MPNQWLTRWRNLRQERRDTAFYHPCGGRSGDAIQSQARDALDCFAWLAMAKQERWCGRWDSNPHEQGSGDFKSPASTIPPRPLVGVLRAKLPTSEIPHPRSSRAKSRDWFERSREPATSASYARLAASAALGGSFDFGHWPKFILSAAALPQAEGLRTNGIWYWRPFVP